MQTVVFRTASAPPTAYKSPSLAKYIVSKEKTGGFSGQTPHGYNYGATEIVIEAKVMKRDCHIKMKDGTVLWADLYQTPDSDILAVRQQSGGPRQIAMLEFYKMQDYGFEVYEKPPEEETYDL